MPMRISALIDETERKLSVERIKMIRELKTNQKHIEQVKKRKQLYINMEILILLKFVILILEF